MFNLEATVALAVKDRATFDSVVLPMLTDEQAEQVRAGLARETAIKARAGLAKQVPDASQDDVTDIAESLEAVAVMLATYAPHKDSGTTGGWSGRVLRMPTSFGHLKVTLTDPK